MIQQTKQRFPFTYQQCESKLTDYKTGKQWKSSCLGPNTYLEPLGESFVIYYKHTPVVIINDDDTFILSAKGAQNYPKGVFDRLSAYSPLPLTDDGGKWHIWSRDGHNHKVPFKSGIKVHKNGSILN